MLYAGAVLPDQRWTERDVNLPSEHRVVRLPASARIWLISDLHLGDGTPNDVFFGKDRHLMALVERVDREGSTLVVNGDVVDFHQAWSFMRVVRAHQELLGALSRLARDGRLIYVIGNHDYDLSLLQDILNFRVCNELHIGDEVLVCHGWRFDAYLSGRINQPHWETKVHHAIERLFNTWVRFPFGEFYTLTNRALMWIGHKAALVVRASQQLRRQLGLSPGRSRLLDGLNQWTWSNQGDSMCIFRPALEALRDGPWPVLVCGHSHLPGIVHSGGRIYANTGSWTFASSQYLECYDWITGRRFEDELYKPLLDGSIYERDFFQWWRENYMGWLRYREGEERHGRLRGWESYIQDHQSLSQLRPLPAAAVGLDEVPEIDEATREGPGATLSEAG